MTSEPDTGPTILVADDEDLIVRALDRLLTGRGYRVHAAGSTDGALDVLDGLGWAVDAALVDANMPGSGLALIRVLLEDERFRGPVILMTGGLEHMEDAVASERVTRLQKPFPFAELPDLIARMMARPRRAP